MFASPRKTDTVQPVLRKDECLPVHAKVKFPKAAPVHPVSLSMGVAS